MATTRKATSHQPSQPAAPDRPLDPDEAVVFRGDGEPKTPERALRALAEFHAETGLEMDNFSLGGTVERLESTFAEMLGTEASIFMPTGTLANHLAIRKHCGTRPRAIVQEQSHLYNDTGDSVAQLSSINLVPLAKDRPYFTLDELDEAVTRSETGRVANPVGAVMIESPVRRQAGQIMPYAEMEAATDYCRRHDIPTHLDGARLYMMSAATGIEPREYAALFDTVYVSLYKYFDAPIGAILAGSSGFVAGMYHDRRTFGGGLNAAYLPAALALKGIQGFEERFAAAMRQARELFDQLNELGAIRIETFEHGSNIFPLGLDERVDVDMFIDALGTHGVQVSPDEADPSRVYLTVNTTILRKSNAQLLEAFAYALASDA